MENLADWVYLQLQEMISKPQWSVGGKLPGEKELAESLGVSRPVLRQALARLRDENVITTRRGSGNYIVPRSDADGIGHPAPFQIRGIPDIEEVFRFRHVIEVAAAVEAASRATDEAIADIAKAHEALVKGKIHMGSPFQSDFGFHLAVASATKTPFFAMTLEWLRPHIELGYDLGRRVRNVPATATSKVVIKEHERVLQAIQARDPELARSTMHDHIMGGLQRLFGKNNF